MVKEVKIINVVGARPNFVKIAPILAAYAACPRIRPLLVHTGQHHDRQMSDLFFEQLGIRQPDINLGACQAGASHAEQTAKIMLAFEPVLLEHLPAVVLVVGDVNSTLACALAAAKLGVRVIHVEAGLRSGDRTMPEEINRLVTDALGDLLFCSEPSAVENLRREGHSPRQVFLVGNVMIDTLLACRSRAADTPVLEDLGLAPRNYAVLTLHRPANVDRPQAAASLLEAVLTIAGDMPVVFPVHPRTRRRLDEFGLVGRLRESPNLRLTEPLGYLEFLRLIDCAALVLTDSGGIQEETTVLQVPCLTLRENTERPITIEKGTNRLVGLQAASILAAYADIRGGRWQRGVQPPLWDGQAARRIVEIIDREL